MRDQLQNRLQTLRQEYAAGEKVLATLEAKQASLRETLLRIGGAIQVLEEELAVAGQQGDRPPPTHKTAESSVLTPEEYPDVG